ncbi:uncharacterized protein G2W53_041112 [Senna tora]|uniref:Uncharacterized protein n=1 Tax=Senna tora TaxID=362788 RepID=A0A834SF73_9FABA|nr:uncharacterized protein G2W53_041112 [Senna tora]
MAINKTKVATVMGHCGDHGNPRQAHKMP